MIKDAQGHEVTGAAAGSVETYDKAVHAYNSGYGDAVGLLDAAIDGIL